MDSRGTCAYARTKMRWSAIAFFAFATCPCSYSTKYNDAENRRSGATGADDCALWVPENGTLKMPVAFTTYRPNVASIIYPDAGGRLNVKRDGGFNLACVSGKFAADALSDSSEAFVTCVGGNSLAHNGTTYEYADFRCDAMPRSTLRVTGDTCQPPDNYTVAAVGYQTERVFLDLYKVCFDKKAKNSVYTWYDARSPYYDNHQKMSRRPPFANSRELYGKTDVNKKYTFNEQKKTVATILGSNELANKYIKNDNKHSLSRGHYAAKADFFFAHEQSATFYYANVAPQWQIFNGQLWAEVEDIVRQNMDEEPSDYLIVTGTYGSCTLPDVDGVQRPLFLDWPDGGIPVPMYYWKMHYDFELDDATVYVGLNHPYAEIDDSVYICPDICPGQFGSDADDGLVYCCTKESFENVYGPLDPIVYHRRPV